MTLAADPVSASRTWEPIFVALTVTTLITFVLESGPRELRVHPAWAGAIIAPLVFALVWFARWLQLRKCPHLDLTAPIRRLYLRVAARKPGEMARVRYSRLKSGEASEGDGLRDQGDDPASPRRARERAAAPERPDEQHPRPHGEGEVPTATERRAIGTSPREATGDTQRTATGELPPEASEARREQAAGASCAEVPGPTDAAECLARPPAAVQAWAVQSEVGGYASSDESGWLTPSEDSPPAWDARGLEGVVPTGSPAVKPAAAPRPASPYVEEEPLAEEEAPFVKLLVLSALTLAFAHGGNDVANSAAPLAVILQYQQHPDGSPTGEAHHTAFWVVLLCGAGFVVGIGTLGSRTIATVGSKLTTLTPSKSYATQVGAALAVLLSSALGMPVSTSHCLVGAVVGCGFAEKLLPRGASTPLEVSVLKRIVVGWVATIPLAMVVSLAVYGSLAWNY